MSLINVLSFALTNVSSYDLKTVNFTIGLVDGLGQIFYESPTGDIELNPSLVNQRSVTMTTNTSTASSSSCDFVNCYFFNTTLILKGAGGENLPINISYQSQENTLPNINITTTLRNCFIGEINSSSNANISKNSPNASICTLCPLNTYSVNISDISCTTCDFEDGADCMGGSDIEVMPGFWRSSEVSTSIVTCPFPEACMGTYISQCKTGYQGPACQSCDGEAGYARSGANKCGICPSKEKQYIISFIILIGTIFYQLYLIRAALLENLAFFESGANTIAKQNAKAQGQYTRLLTTYSQIISVILTFHLQYPALFSKSLQPASQAAGSPTSTIFASISCLLIDMGYNPEMISTYEVILAFSIPLLKMIIISVALFLFFTFCRKDMDPVIKRAYYLISIVCIILVEQPGLFKTLVGYLTCIQLDDTGPYYLISDYGVQCDTPNYNLYRNYFVIPGLLAWGLFIPGGFFYLLYVRHRKGDLNNKFLRLNMGAIYNEYTDDAYYWGIVLMITKLMLMLVSALLYNNTKTNAMTIFVVLYI